MQQEDTICLAPVADQDARMPLTFFFADIHRRDHPCLEWKGRIACYVANQSAETVERVLHELRRTEARLLPDARNPLQPEDGSPVLVEESEPRVSSYRKWIRYLAETVDVELKALQENQC